MNKLKTIDFEVFQSAMDNVFTYIHTLHIHKLHLKNV